MAYYSTTSPPQSKRDQFIEPPSIFEHRSAALPPLVAVLLRKILGRANYASTSSNTPRIPWIWPEAQRRFNPRRLLNVPNAFIVIWIISLLWGERWVFAESISACQWTNWERWPQTATPHHLIFLADPQLIDPHTYPNRPWPLSTLTVLHTDNYLRRSYIQLQKSLHPDTIFFLGDLFDGGREWGRQGDGDPSWAATARPHEEQAVVGKWRKIYGEDFWLREYNRFGEIFFKHWSDGGTNPGLGQRGRRVIASLPGNHDLGFGANIKIPVRNRFQAYFGDTNRVDVIGNHTFVSVDSVSLSATAVEQQGVDTKEIYGPVDEFLKNVQALKRRAVARELRYQNGEVLELQQEHEVSDLEDADYSQLPSLDPGGASHSFPTILLTHVPLYRAPGTPCGPLREHWPPSLAPPGQIHPINPDERNAISISKGYQYQNVLSDDDSRSLISEIGDVVSVFSGDDHDYCEVVHADKNNVREITVKSISYAMGVRKPGFVMLSMWNPVDPNGAPAGTLGGGHGATTSSGSTAPTIEPHLCLLPDQIGILIRYAALIVVTLIVLTTRALMTPFFGLTPFSPPPCYSPNSDIQLLPTSSKDVSVRHDREGNGYHFSRSSNSSTSSTSSNSANNLAPRNTAARTRSVSPATGSYGLPANQARYAPPLIDNVRNAWKEDDGLGHFGSSGKVKAWTNRAEPRRLTKTEMIMRETWTSIWRVLWVVGLYYLYLARYG